LAEHTYDVVADREGRVSQIDNRYISRLAKLAGAPHAKGAGVKLYAPLGTTLKKGQPLFTVYAETKSELDYALAYLAQEPNIIHIETD